MGHELAGFPAWHFALRWMFGKSLAASRRGLLLVELAASKRVGKWLRGIVCPRFQVPKTCNTYWHVCQEIKQMHIDVVCIDRL